MLGKFLKLVIKTTGIKDDKFVANQSYQGCLDGWMDGWMAGWASYWDVKAVLLIAHGNQKCNFPAPLVFDFYCIACKKVKLEQCL
jgi:hypothetical protein